MSKVIGITYCGMYGEGETVRDAKQCATRKIEAALSGSYFPEIIPCGNIFALLYRDPKSGWSYKIMDNIPQVPEYITGCNSGFSDDDDCRRAARRHLAQNAWTHECGMKIPNDIIKDTHDRADFLSWARWQINYKSLRTQGHSDESSREMASRI